MLTINGQPATKTQAKPKPKIGIAVPKVAPQPTETEKLADTIIEQYPVIESAKEPKKLSDAARKELLELVEATSTDKEPITVHGTLGTVKFSAKSDSLVCTDLKKVHEILGDDAFYALASVGITELKKYLTMHQLADVTEQRTGSRTMTVLPKQE